jgi:hypothetical protein
MLCRLFAIMLLVRDVGTGPTSSRFNGECIIHLRQSRKLISANSGGGRRTERRSISENAVPIRLLAKIAVIRQLL